MTQLPDWMRAGQMLAGAKSSLEFDQPIGRKLRQDLFDIKVDGERVMPSEIDRSCIDDPDELIRKLEEIAARKP